MRHCHSRDLDAAELRAIADRARRRPPAGAWDLVVAVVYGLLVAYLAYAIFGVVMWIGTSVAAPACDPACDPASGDAAGRSVVSAVCAFGIAFVVASVVSSIVRRWGRRS